MEHACPRWLPRMVLAMLAAGPAMPGAVLASDAATIERGAKVFATVQPACKVCHTLQAAGADGQVGPVLDELRPDAARVLRALRAGIGVMPSYAAILSEADMQALAAFVAQAAAGAAKP